MHAMLDLIDRATASCAYIAKQRHKQASREQRNRQPQSITQTGSSRNNELR